MTVCVYKSFHRERERERDRQTDRQTDKHTYTHTHTGYIQFYEDFGTTSGVNGDETSIVQGVSWV